MQANPGGNPNSVGTPKKQTACQGDEANCTLTNPTRNFATDMLLQQSSVHFSATTMALICILYHLPRGPGGIHLGSVQAFSIHASAVKSRTVALHYNDDVITLPETDVTKTSPEICQTWLRNNTFLPSPKNRLSIAMPPKQTPPEKTPSLANDLPYFAMLSNQNNRKCAGFVDCITNLPNKKPFFLEEEEHKRMFQRESDFDGLSPIVSNCGKTARLMPFWPSITTFTLVSGWDDEKTRDLQNAVREVVRRNPVLTGQAKFSSRLTHPAITIHPGAFSLEKGHEFVREIWANETTTATIAECIHTSEDSVRCNDAQLLQCMDDCLAPLVPPAESVIESIKHQSPLFGVDLVQLGNGYACYVMRLSHCLGDGVTYYYVMNELNHYFNHKTDNLKAIDWISVEIAEHELWPDRFSDKDIKKSYGLPSILGLCRNAVHMDQQKKGYLLLSKEKVKAKQRLLNQGRKKHVSPNDIITAALCEANGSSDIFAFTINKRPQGYHYGFNFHQEVPFPRKTAKNPFAFRKILKKGWHYDHDQLPLWPFVLGRTGRISSLTSIQKWIASPDVHVLCHAVLSSFVQNIPLDVAFILSLNKDTYVILHNFRKLRKKGGLLQQLRQE